MTQDNAEKQKYTSVPVIRTALGFRCPRCGEGDIFGEKRMTIAENCTQCGLPLGLHESGDGPAVFLIFILGFLFVPFFLFFGRAMDWPFWVILLLMTLTTLVAILVLLKFAKALTIALSYKYRPQDFENPELGRQTRT